MRNLPVPVWHRCRGEVIADLNAARDAEILQRLP
jgi:hypothetical protein